MTGPILLFGGAGQVGRETASQAATLGIDVVSLSKIEANILSLAQLEGAIRDIKPRLVVNAAAYTAVDLAESEPLAAEAINARGAENVAVASATLDIPIIHISTDYVFDGSKDGAYTEADPISPLNVYGISKAKGEALVGAANPRSFIIRTAWVYGEFGKNFVKAISQLARSKDKLRIVSDQKGCPTSAIDIAHAIFAIDGALQRHVAMPGLYHFASRQETTWYEFAKVIVDQQSIWTGKKPEVEPIATRDYPTAARRPANSVLDSSRFTAAFGYIAAPWELRTRALVDELNKSSTADGG